MRQVQVVNVMYHDRKVGTLSMGSDYCCRFEYDGEWLASGFSISPLHLPLKSGLFTASYLPFNGDFGIFSFICSDGQWRLAPAYDLTNDQTLGEHATSINFKGLPTIEDMIVVGTNIKMTKQRCREIIDEVATVVKKM